MGQETLTTQGPSPKRQKESRGDRQMSVRSPDNGPFWKASVTGICRSIGRLIGGTKVWTDLAKLRSTATGWSTTTKHDDLVLSNLILIEVLPVSSLCRFRNGDQKVTRRSGSYQRLSAYVMFE